MLNGTDYFPFGSEMRSSRLANYRFGFNGKELDKSQEFGILNAYDYGFRIYNPGIGRFLSVDPLIQKYPELTPYQFASNTPIQAVDLDGLEQYYAADGSFIGNSGKSTEIRIIAGKDVIVKAKENLAHSNYEHGWLLSYSQPAYMANAMQEENILRNWVKEYRPKTIDREYGMSLFTKMLKAKDGKPFEVMMVSTSPLGEKKDKYGGAELDITLAKPIVNNIDLEKEYGWKRSTTIHTHPDSGYSTFSNQQSLLGDSYVGDIPFAIRNNVKMLLATRYDGWIQLFDPKVYQKKNPEGLNGGSYAHEKASKEATNEYFMYVGY